MKYSIEMIREYENETCVFIGRITKRNVKEYDGEETLEYVFIPADGVILTLTEIEEVQRIINHLSLYDVLSEGMEK